MLNNLLNLFVADVKRLKKYNIFNISFFLAVLYVIILIFTSAQESKTIVTMLVFVDVSMMSIIMLGASLFFEKQEGSLKSLMVTPVNLIEIVISKILSITLLSFVTAIVLGLVANFVHGANINIALLLLFDLLGTILHVSIGFVLSILSKDFNSLLINYTIFVLVFTLPVILFSANVIPANLEFLIYISPSYVTQILINTSIGMTLSIGMYIFAILYSIAIIICIYVFFVSKKFKDYVMRG